MNFTLQHIKKQALNEHYKPVSGRPVHPAVAAPVADIRVGKIGFRDSVNKPEVPIPVNKVSLCENHLAVRDLLSPASRTGYFYKVSKHKNDKF